MKTQQLHEDTFLKILWDDQSRVIGIDWKEATSSMTDEDFKKELTLFADHVEAKKAHGILIDVARFRHKPGPDIEEWRVKNISGRYYAAGVRRFAFLFPESVPIPPMMNQSSPREKFATRAFNGAEEALAWLKAADRDAAILRSTEGSARGFDSPRLPDSTMAVANISAEFPFDSRFVKVHGSTMHYVESGAGDPIVFLHGNPTSSYLWRNVIPHLSPLGRCIAPDLIGMGRSGKPEIEYRFFDHVRYVEGFLETLGLRDVTLVIHDWGSALGFDYAMRHPKNIKAIAFLEAIVLPLPDLQAFPDGMREMFRAFRSPDQGRKLIIDQNIFIESVLPNAILRKLSEEEMNRYREPFLEPKSREPLWRWPNEIPIGGEPADVEAVVTDYNLKLQQSEIPKLLLYATPGAVLTAPLVEWCRRSLKNLTAVNVGAGVHYLQEDHPHEIGAAIADWYRAL